ncbi:hypothetical protein PGT21_010547 [Puccinia graminis f. sp. tritici]|uniref:Uncharacterized protein n=1 Tax=Puccinia graminis f. sp. tritici TaxID=56615 RepID=A0A5B0LMP7_PUCGR|nr:hypothetical protein PGT21_010547 [Puccinia graminis f. sp. tritici]KAA1132340.1 hypothetical protein PGTUg99_003671 [Puccinia graminis f. sp. tritici]
MATSVDNTLIVDYRLMFFCSPHRTDIWLTNLAILGHSFVATISTNKAYQCIQSKPRVFSPIGVQREAFFWRAGREAAGSSSADMYNNIDQTLFRPSEGDARAPVIAASGLRGSLANGEVGGRLGCWEQSLKEVHGRLLVFSSGRLDEARASHYLPDSSSVVYIVTDKLIGLTCMHPSCSHTEYSLPTMSSSSTNSERVIF